MVGLSVKRLRKIRRLTQEELASALGVSRQAVCMWEANKRELRASMLNKLAKVLGVSVNEIVKVEALRYNTKRLPTKRQAGTTLTKKEEDMEMKGRKRRIDFELRAPNAKRVALTGNFNAWDKHGVPMKKDKSGLWQATLNLEPGRYEYKFIVDGQWWTDPTNRNTVTNSFGSTNSIREIAAK